MLEVGIIRISPSLVHTPNAYFSTNRCIESRFTICKVNNKLSILSLMVEGCKNICVLLH